ncbi:MAG TPA: ATP-binding cassette domain-containing protein [Sphingobacteriaceae bacterium]
MQISLANIGRRFNREWIFRGVSQSFTSGNSYAILGPNGSGKSTLLNVIAGALTPSEGEITYFKDSQSLEHDKVFPYLSIAAPYLELIEEFTLNELIDFHFKFKKPLAGQTPEALIGLLQLEKARNKQIKYFSSGMKQRVKLALAVCSQTPVVLLDEPTSNLDKSGIEWYLRLIEDNTLDRLVIIGSNQEHEYSFCNHHIFVTNYK